MTNTKRFFLLIALNITFFLLSAQAAFSEANGLESYRKHNPGTYENALPLYYMLKEQMDSLGYTDSDFALAIVFPEIMRYSLFRDEIETMVTRLLYTAGPESEGCSIGHFQMKPIFAESVEQEILRDAELSKRFSIINFGGNKSTKTARSLRISRLRVPETEFAYLEAFIAIATKKLNLENDSTDYKIKMLAAAYNAGFYWSRQQLEIIMERDSYPTAGDDGKTSWNYAQIALDFYREQN